MKLKEKIEQAISLMEHDELILLFEQIQLMQRMKRAVQGSPKTTKSIETILEMTCSSEGNWSDTVIEDRRERS